MKGYKSAIFWWPVVNCLHVHSFNDCLQTAQDLFDGATYKDVINEIPELKDVEVSLSVMEKEARSVV